MANRFLFSQGRGEKADTTNEAGGVAYALSDKEALTQLVVTGCFNGTFYASAETQLEQVIKLAANIEPIYLAQLAVYARKNAYMKDSPAVLLAILSRRNTVLFKAVFDQVVDNSKMLRTFVQIMRSGVTGRRSLGSAPKKMIEKWLRRKNARQLLNDSIGNCPSLADVIKMVHPRPVDTEQEAMFAYLIGRDCAEGTLPANVQAYERFKKGEAEDVPDVDFRLLTSLPLKQQDWKDIALNANWHMTRMNLNSFNRHGCFEDKALTQLISERLKDKSLIKRAKVFPYQLMSAYYSAQDIPESVREALKVAMDIALENVPKIQGKTYVFVDVSGSMQSPITGYRRGASTTMRCVDVAALFAAALLKAGGDISIVPFDKQVHDASFNKDDSVLTITQKLIQYGGGGTACGVPMAVLNKQNQQADTIIYFSDNESWADRSYWAGSTSLANEWAVFKKRNPEAKLILTDLQPYSTTQAKTKSDVLNVGGFSDQVFNVIGNFINSKVDANYWTNRVSSNVKLELP